MAITKYRRLPRSPFRILSNELLESRRVLASLSGTVYEDINVSANFDAGDLPVSKATVYLDANRNGVLDQLGFGMDPDEFEPGHVLNRARQTVFPSGTGLDNQPAFRIVAVDDLANSSTGQRVFGSEDGPNWVAGSRLRFDFTVAVEAVSLDVIGSSGMANADVRLDAFSEDGQLLVTATENNVAQGEGRHIEIVRGQEDISHVVAYVTSTTGSATFDNLRANDAGSERATLTSDTGLYRFLDVPPGDVTVALETSQSYDQTTPEGSHELSVEGQDALFGIDFGTRTSSISGFVFEDRGTVGEFEPSVDQGIPGVGVFLDANQNGLPDSRTVDISPDIFLEDLVLDFVSNFVELSTADSDNMMTGANVVAASDPVASPDGQVFTNEGNPAWTNDIRFRADFSAPAKRVELRFIGGTEGLERGRLVAFSPSGVEITSTETRDLGPGETQMMTIDRPNFEIGYIVAYTSEVAPGNITGSGRLTDLRTVLVREQVTITDDLGEYQFKPLVSGDYSVRILPSTTLEQSFPGADVQRVDLETGESEIDVDFGFTIANDPPIALNDVASTIEDSPVSIGVLVNDEDPDGQLDEQSVTITTQPANGTAVVNSNGLIEYTPSENFFGRDSLNYTVLDDEGAISNTAVVTIDVTPVNDAPIVVDDRVSLVGSGTTQIAVLANDVDIDSEIDTTTVTIVSQPNNGTVEVDEVTGVITYTANSADNDSFTYIVDDEQGLSSNLALVTISSLSLGTAPVAVEDIVTTLEGTATEIAVTVNDTDADGTIDVTSVFVVSEPTNGSVEVRPNGRVEYQPNLGFIGEDIFTYRVRDNVGLASNVAQVKVTMSERDFPYQNPIDANDVDGNGIVIPRDILFIIMEINNKTITDETGLIVQEVPAGQRPVAYYDVDGNGFITPRDVLGVIRAVDEANSVNGEPDDAQMAVAAISAAFADNFNVLDDDEEA